AQCMLFSVTDTGAGIPEDKQELVFQRFEKLNEFVQGTGLGLAICKLTIQRMGGDIWIDKNYKNGARFVFSHPIKKRESEEK
ncbi:HAMP domain-containing histidine kinase, partial [Bacteroides thetaiotaomicron]